MNNGIIPVNKPQDWTSFDVVNKIKHLLKIKKVGHLGTLDPMATGVLLVTVNKATKLFDLMQEKKKTYIAKFEFGYSTDTLDATGKIEQQTDNLPSIEMLNSIKADFIGEIDQIPPKYSAKSINGKRAYVLARQNIEFEISAKKVKIYDIDFIEYKHNVLTLKIVCGSGTYIRSLCRDIAKKVNSLATMTGLVRTDVGNFNIKNCIDINKLTSDNIKEFIIKEDEVLNLPKLKLKKTEINKILNGQTLTINKESGLYLLKEENNTIAIVKIDNNKAKMSIFLN